MNISYNHNWLFLSFFRHKSKRVETQLNDLTQKSETKKQEVKERFIINSKDILIFILKIGQLQMQYQQLAGKK